MAIESFGYDSKSNPIPRRQGGRIDRDGIGRVSLRIFEGESSPLLKRLLAQIGLTSTGSVEGSRPRSSARVHGSGFGFRLRGKDRSSIDPVSGTHTGLHREELERINRFDPRKSFVPIDEVPDTNEVDQFSVDDRRPPEGDESEDFDTGDGYSDDEVLIEADTGEVHTLKHPDSVSSPENTEANSVYRRIRNRRVSEGSAEGEDTAWQGRVPVRDAGVESADLSDIDPERYSDYWQEHEGWQEDPLSVDVGDDYNSRHNSDDYDDVTGYDDLESDLPQRTSIRTTDEGRSYNAGHQNDTTTGKSKFRNKHSRSNEHHAFRGRGALRRFLGKWF